MTGDPLTITWLTAFLDFPTATHQRGAEFWEHVTTWSRSAPRGGSAQFATLEPGSGASILRVQRLEHLTSPRVHLDVHVPELAPAVRRAESLGAQVLQRGTHAVMQSPAGLAFCLVTGPGGDRPGPIDAGAGLTIPDQVAIDVPPSMHDVERAFWAELTGWEVAASAVLPDFSVLLRQPGLAYRLLFQQLLDERAPGMHLDFSVSDREAETARHVSLGSTVVLAERVWTVLRDPAGMEYCLTDRNPLTGLLGS